MGADDVLTGIGRLREAGRAALLRHDFRAAEEAFTQALRSAGRERPETLVELYGDLARACELTGRFAQARDLRTAADSLAARLGPQPDLSVAGLRRLVDRLRGDPARRADLGAMLKALAALERHEADSVSAARTHLEESVEIGLELEPESAETLERRASLASVRALDGDAEGALALAAELRERLCAELPVAASVLLRSMAQVRLRTGDLAGGIADAVDAVELAESAGAPEEHAAALSALGMLRVEGGDLDAGIALYERALEIRDRHPGAPVPTAMMLVRLARAHRARGRLDAASEALSRAVGLLQADAPRSRELGEAASLLGEVKLQLGDFGGALRALRKSVETAGSEPERLRRTVQLADAHKQLGRYEEARRMLGPAIAGAAARGDTDLEARATMVLAGVERWSGDLDTAARLYEGLVESLAGEPSKQGQAYANLGGVHYERGDFARAAEHYRRGLSLLGDDDPSREGAQGLVHNLASALEGMGEHAEADALYAGVIARVPGTSRLHLEALAGRARIAVAAGRLDDGVAAYRAVVATAETMLAAAGGEASRRSLFELVHHHYGELVAVLHRRSGPGDAEAALELAELSRARTLEERLRATASPETQLEEQRLRGELAAASRRLLAARSAPAAHPAVLGELAAHERELAVALEDLERPPSPEPAARTLPADAVRAALGPQEVLLEFLQAGNRMFMWTMTRSAVALHRLAADAATLTDLVVRAITPYHQGGDVEGDRQAWDELRRLLLGPAQPLLATAGTLLVSPSGPLHFVSFDALVDGPTVVYVPSATVMLTAREARPARPVDAAFAGFGDPAFDQTLPEFAGLPRLPGARAEVEEIAALFGRDGVARCSAEATEPEVRSWARRCRYLHLAAHGLVDLENPLRSGIVLATPPMPQLDRSGHDDMLHGYEMLDLQIEAELVVCAACRTGFGHEHPGEGLATIGSALLQGGARWVLVTLWPVGDLVSAAFAHALYGALRDGAPVPAAVAGARAEIRAFHDDPYWWGAFALFGAGG